MRKHRPGAGGWQSLVEGQKRLRYLSALERSPEGGLWVSENIQTAGKSGAKAQGRRVPLCGRHRHEARVTGERDPGSEGYRWGLSAAATSRWPVSTAAGFYSRDVWAEPRLRFRRATVWRERMSAAVGEPEGEGVEAWTRIGAWKG